MLELDEVGQYYMRNQNYCPRNPRPWSWQSTSPHIDTFNIQWSELSADTNYVNTAVHRQYLVWYSAWVVIMLLFVVSPRHKKNKSQRSSVAVKSRTLEKRAELEFNMNQRLGKSWFVIDVCNWFWNWCRVGKVVPLSPLELQTKAKLRFAKISQSFSIVLIVS